MWEKVVRKIRSGMMPPSGARRPERVVLDAFAGELETRLDRAVAAAPNPGTPVLTGTAITNSFAGATASTHYALDVATGSLVRQTSVNGALTTVGAFNVGVTFAVEGGFDIAGGENGLAIAALVPTGGTQSTLYRVNLSNGTLAPLGLLGGNAAISVRALAVRLQ